VTEDWRRPPPPPEPVKVPAWVDRELYPFTPLRMELEKEGALAYVDEGPRDAPPVVFVHGTPTWSFEWRHMIGALKATHRCLAPDHLGFGLSERPFGAQYAPEDHARRFRTWLDALKLENVTLVVHDFGGPIGLPAALDRSGPVRRLVVLNSFMWSFEDDPDMARKARFAGGGLGLWMYRNLNASLRLITPSAYADRKKLTKRIHAQLLAPFTGIDSRERVLWALAHALLGSSEFYRSEWEQRAALADQPSMLIWGTKDPAFPPRFLARWREVLPKAEVVEIPVGHWPQEEAPEAVTEALQRFLATA
jgi:haloalkane dehalogenase